MPRVNNRDRRVMIVSYEYPPKGGAGVQRPAKFAKYLPEYGWKPLALTVADPPTRAMDESLAAEVADVPTRRVWSLEPTRLYVALGALKRRMRPGGQREEAGGQRDESGGRPGTRTLTGLPTWLIHAVQALFVPDEKIGWYPWAVRAGTEMVRAQHVDAIFASGPPFTGFLVARAISRRTGVPWVADFRDPWVDHYYMRPPTPLHAFLARRWEAKVAAEAAAVVATTPSVTAAFTARYPDRAEKFTTITNGFDRDDFPAVGQDVPGGPKFVVAHMGSFYEQRNPGAFLRAAAELSGESPEFARDVEIGFIGAADPLTEAIVNASPLKDKIRMAGFLPHNECLSRFRRAQLLLFVTNPDESRMHLAGKVFEYLAIGRPILALTGSGEAGRIIQDTGSGIVVDPGDITAVKEALNRLYQDFRSGSSSISPDEIKIAQFERRELTKQLAGVLNGVVGPS